MTVWVGVPAPSPVRPRAGVLQHAGHRRRVAPLRGIAPGGGIGDRARQRRRLPGNAGCIQARVAHEQPGTWVTDLTDDMGDSLLVSFIALTVTVGPVGLWVTRQGYP